MLPKLAWRNLWRNRRRTLITMASIIMAVFLSIALNSMQEGSWDRMLDNIISQYTGYGQLHADGYWEDKSINNAMPEWTLDSLPAVPSNLQGLVPRLESFSLLASDNKTLGGKVVGIDPAKENALTGLQDKVIEGRYLADNDKALLVSSRLADNLMVGVGDTLILLGQGYHGVSAVGKYPVKGIVKYSSPDLDKTTLLLPLQEAQYLFGAYDKVTSHVLHLEQSRNHTQTVKALREMVGADTEVMTWEELMPDLVQAIQADKGGNYIMQFIIYLIIGFGIFSTILMMTAERTKEFGVLLAIGMKRWRLKWMVTMELIWLALLGVLVGVLISLPLVLYLAAHPIYPGGEMSAMFEEYGLEPVYVMSTDPAIFYNQVFLILAITALVLIYPILKLNRMKAVEAMRG